LAHPRPFFVGRGHSQFFYFYLSQNQFSFCSAKHNKKIFGQITTNFILFSLAMVISYVRLSQNKILCLARPKSFLILLFLFFCHGQVKQKKMSWIIQTKRI
jgi:O-antigen ligase